jgi:IS30 family transposase
MAYKQLTYEKRIEIKAYFKLGYNQSEIANLIDVNKSTISRELKNNSGLRGYRPKQAQEKINDRKKNARKNIHFTDTVKERVIFHLKQDWSPEQISNYLKINEDIHISHETIYQFINLSGLTKKLVVSIINICVTPVKRERNDMEKKIIVVR